MIKVQRAKSSKKQRGAVCFDGEEESSNPYQKIHVVREPNWHQPTTNTSSSALPLVLARPNYPPTNNSNTADASSIEYDDNNMNQYSSQRYRNYHDEIERGQGSRKSNLERKPTTDTSTTSTTRQSKSKSKVKMKKNKTNNPNTTSTKKEKKDKKDKTYAETQLDDGYDDAKRKRVNALLERIACWLLFLIAILLFVLVGLSAFSAVRILGEYKQENDNDNSTATEGHGNKSNHNHKSNKMIVGGTIGLTQMMILIVKEMFSRNRFGNVESYHHPSYSRIKSLSLLYNDVPKPPTMLLETSEIVSSQQPNSESNARTKQNNNSTSSSSLLYLNNVPSYQRLCSSRNNTGDLSYSADYYAISSSGWDAQINQAYCGVASAVAIINSLKVMGSSSSSSSSVRRKDNVVNGLDLPMDRLYSPYHYATQHDVFDACTQKNVVFERNAVVDEHNNGENVNKVEQQQYQLNKERYASGPIIDGILAPPYGLSLQQVGSLLKCHLDLQYWNVSVTMIDPSSPNYTVGTVRHTLMNALADLNSRVLVNFYRPGIGQVGGGHFSPLGAYHQPSDSFLVMDVAKYKYAPVWAPSEMLFKSMSGPMDHCGHWNWPDAQTQLSQYANVYRKRPETVDEWIEVADTLGCEATHRGFIIVTKL